MKGSSRAARRGATRKATQHDEELLCSGTVKGLLLGGVVKGMQEELGSTDKSSSGTAMSMGSSGVAQ